MDGMIAKTTSTRFRTPFQGLKREKNAQEPRIKSCSNHSVTVRNVKMCANEIKEK